MLTVYSQNVWNHFPTSFRNNLIRTLIDDFDADLCAFQECGPETIRVGEASLPSLMRNDYDEVCPEYADRNFTPIFYKRDKFSITDSGYFLFDGMNDCDSKSVTWAVFLDKITGKSFGFVSTHFWWMFESEKDDLQRIENVRQLKEICDTLVEKYSVPVIVCGDINSGVNKPQGEGAYQEMLKKGFSDIRYTAEETTDAFTHHDYPEMNERGNYVKGTMPTGNLDYIFTYGKKKAKAKKFDVMTTQEALNSSDHCPLVAWFEK